MNTYYIVERKDSDGDRVWAAHTGLMARLGWFDILSTVEGTYTTRGADACEQHLRVALAAREIKPRVVRVVEI